MVHASAEMAASIKGGDYHIKRRKDNLLESCEKNADAFVPY
jgi:hypothetical protein